MALGAVVSQRRRDAALHAPGAVTQHSRWNVPGVFMPFVLQAAGEPGTYLVVLRRYRFDNMPSSRFIVRRGRVVGGLRDQLVADPKREKAAAEKSASQ